MSEKISETDYLSILASVVALRRSQVTIRGSVASMSTKNDINHIIIPCDGALDEYPLLSDVSAETKAVMDSYLEVKRSTVETVATNISRADDEVRAFLRNTFLYHECAHSRYSPPTSTLRNMNDALKMAYNFFEDRRIETLLASDFPNMYDRFRAVNQTTMVGFEAKLKEVEQVEQQGVAVPNEIKMYLFMVASEAKCLDLDVPSEYAQHPVTKRIVEMVNDIESDPENKEKPLNYAIEIMKMLDVDMTPPPIKLNIGPGDSLDGDQKNENEQDNNEGENDGQNNKNDEDRCDKGQAPKNNNMETNCKTPHGGISAKDIDDLNEEYRRMRIQGLAVGKDLRMNLKTVKLLDQVLVNNLANILKNMRGSRRSIKEINSDDGYAIDVGEIMQIRANKTAEGFKPFIDSDKNAPEYDIVVCIDHSGSMAEYGKMENAKRSVANFIKACEQVKIDTAILAFDMCIWNTKDFDLRLEDCSLGALKADGGTDISAALERANQMLEVRKRKVLNPRKQAIILASDGEDRNTEDIALQLSRAKRNDVALFFIGIGQAPAVLIKGLAEYTHFDHACIIDESGANMGTALRHMAERFIKESE